MHGSNQSSPKSVKHWDITRGRTPMPNVTFHTQLQVVTKHHACVAFKKRMSGELLKGRTLTFSHVKPQRQT